MTNELAITIRRLREQSPYSRRKDFAAQAGISLRQLEYIEAGHKVPRQETLDRLIGIGGMSKSKAAQLRRLERKIDWLTRLVYVQIAMLAVFGVSYMFQVARTLVLFLMVAVPLLIVFRGSLPRWARKIGRLIATFARKTPSP